MATIRSISVDLNDCVMGPPSSLLYQGFDILAQIAERAKKTNSFLMGACSGREMPYVRAVLHLLGSPRGWSIYESGLGLFNVEEEKWLPNPALTHEIRRAFKRQVSGKRIPRLLRKRRGVRFYRGNEISVALELETNAELTLEELEEEVKEALRDLIAENLVIVHRSSQAVDITPPGIDKGSGILFLEEVTGIPRSEMLGIGDSGGDRPMLECVGFVGCPSNASPWCQEFVRSKGGNISNLPYAAGVADVIRHFLPEEARVLP